MPVTRLLLQELAVPRPLAAGWLALVTRGDLAGDLMNPVITNSTIISLGLSDPTLFAEWVNFINFINASVSPSPQALQDAATLWKNAKGYFNPIYTGPICPSLQQLSSIGNNLPDSPAAPANKAAHDKR